MRASFLVAVGAFAAGVLVGHLANGREARSVRARDFVVETERPRADPVTPQAGEALEARAAEAGRSVTSGASPDVDLPLDAGTEFARWQGEEFARWYAIHKRAWDLPDFDEASLEKYGDTVVALGRIPRREVLLVVLGALRELDRALAPLIEESAAWRAANPGAQRDDPAARAYEERLRNEHQRCFDRLHRQLAYSDYLFLLTRAEGDVETRPPPGGPLPGGDPYARPVADARESFRFWVWYHGYRHELGFPERDEEFLGEFHQHVVAPLGRLPEPALMRALQDAYLPVYPRLRDRADEDGTVRDFFARLAQVLSPLDYERMRHSHEWMRICRALSIPEAPYFPAGR